MSLYRMTTDADRLQGSSRHCALSLEREDASAFSMRSAQRIAGVFQNPGAGL